MPSITIRKALPEDFPSIYACHCAAFPRSFTTLIGSSYGYKMLEWYLKDAHAYLWVALVDGKIAGYLGAQALLTPEQRGAVGSIKAYAWKEIKRSLLRKPWLFLHPEVIKQGLTLLKRRLGLPVRPDHYIPAGGQSMPGTPRFGLIVIGLHPGFQGSGAAAALEEAFCGQARLLQIPVLTLTVLRQNAKAQKFYEKNSWKRTAANNNSFLYQKKLEL